MLNAFPDGDARGAAEVRLPSGGRSFLENMLLILTVPPEKVRQINLNCFNAYFNIKFGSSWYAGLEVGRVSTVGSRIRGLILAFKGKTYERLFDC